MGIPQSCRFLIRLRCGIPPADSSIKGFACIPRPRPDRQTRPGLLPRQINCMPLPYYITACILQGLLSLCLSMSACCQLLFKKQHTLSDMHTYQDPYSVFTAFIPRSFLFVRGARTLHAKQQDARCVLRKWPARTTPAQRPRHAAEYRQVIRRPCIHTAPNTRHQHRAQGSEISEAARSEAAK